MGAFSPKQLKKLIEDKTDIKVVFIELQGNNHHRLWLEKDGETRHITVSGTTHDNGRARHKMLSDARREFRKVGKNKDGM